MKINETDQIEKIVAITGGGYSARVFVDEASILVFCQMDESLKSQQNINEEDAIKTSFAYAQLEANNAYNKLNEQENWYNTFIQAMKALGWKFEQDINFKNYNKDSFSLKMLVLDSLKSCESLSDKERGIVISLFNKLKNMPESEKEKLNKFVKSSTDSNSSNFRFGIYTKSDNGKVIFNLMSFYFNTNEQIQDIFTDNFHREGNIFKIASQNISLDLSVYEKSVENFKRMFSIIDVQDYIEELY